jgi:hypothetical protein
MFILKEQGTFARYFALFVILSSLIISSLIIFSFPSSFSFFLPAKTQNPITLKDLVTYSRQSSFIKEFPVPLAERGLKRDYHRFSRKRLVLSFNQQIKYDN